MTDSAASALAIILGLGVFLTIVAIGWRSVQNRRILRLQDASGQETIIVAREDDEVSSVVSTTETVTPEPATTADSASSVRAVDAGVVDPVPAVEPRRGAAASETPADAYADTVARDRLDRVVSSAE